MRKVFFYLCFPLLFLNALCEADPLEEGIETRVYGKVYDEVNEIPIENYKIFVAEYKDRFRPGSGGSNNDFIQYVDSTITDSSGNFDFIFTTSGQGNSYEIHLNDDIRFWDYYDSQKEISNVGDDNEINFDVLKLFPAKLNIILDNVDFTPIYIEHFFTSDFGSRRQLPSITINNGTEVRQILIDKTSKQIIKFYRNLSNSESQLFEVEIPATETSSLTEFDIILKNEFFQ